MFAPSKNLYQHIIVRVGLLLVMVLAAFAYVGLRAVEDGTSMAFYERQTIARALASGIDDLLELATREIEALSRSPAVDLEDGELESERAALNRAFQHLDRFSAIGLLDTSGALLLAVPTPQAPIGTPDPNPAVRESLQERRMTLGQKLQNGGRPPTVTIYVPVADRSGRVTGLMYADLGINRTGFGFFSALKLNHAAYAEIVDRAGVVVASSRTDHLRKPHDALESILPMVATRQAGVARHRVPPGGEQADHVVAVAPVQVIPWSVIVEQDVDVALALPQRLQIEMLLLGGVLLPVVILLAWLDVRGVVGPLRMLTVGARRIAAGNLEETVAIARLDEIGVLAQSFEAMRVQLRASLAQIEGWNRDLEARVEERTQEVERRNRELSGLNTLAATVSQSLNLDEVLDAALDKVLEVTETDAGGIRLLQPQSGRLLLQVHRSLSPGCLEKDGDMPMGECRLCEQVVALGQPTVVEGLRDCPDVPCSLEGLGSLALAPLKSKQKVLGVVYVGRCGQRRFAPEDLQLLTSIGNQISMAIENARLYEELQRREELRGQLLEKIIAAQEEERKRIARELHDESAQALTALTMGLQSLEDNLPSRLHRQRAGLARIKGQAAQVLAGMRQLILDLRPTALDDLGLVPALHWYARSHLEAAGVAVRFEALGEGRRLSPQVETALFRLVQEAINNIARHAEAASAHIQLEVEGGVVRVRVEDDGKGFWPEDVLRSKDGTKALGLLGMEERVSLLRGSLHVSSAPGQGTVVLIVVPV